MQRDVDISALEPRVARRLLDECSVCSSSASSPVNITLTTSSNAHHMTRLTAA